MRSTILSGRLSRLKIRWNISFEGVNQIQVSEKSGLTFARGLRSILRHDPDVILIGEIRDQETAQIAVQASLTGHLVFSTLHTNDAPGALTRLVDMGVEPYLVASSLEAVLAQRLVRVLCNALQASGGSVTRGTGLQSAGRHSGRMRRFISRWVAANAARPGFMGRHAIFEWMDTDNEIRQLILKNASSDLIREAAREDWDANAGGGRLAVGADGYYDGGRSPKRHDRERGRADHQEGGQRW